MCAKKFLLVSMGGRAEGLACADLGARTPLGGSGNLFSLLFVAILTSTVSCKHLLQALVTFNLSTMIPFCIVALFYILVAHDSVRIC